MISACLIIRDDASTLEACLLSIKDNVDEIIVVDTGSVDGSPEIARKCGAKVTTFLECNDPETGLIQDFALARNKSFELASHEWVFWVDGDDVVVGAEHLRLLCDKYSTIDNVKIILPYEYSHDEKGNCITLQYRERLMRPRHRWQWVNPVHEAPVLTSLEGSYVEDSSDLVRVIHRTQHSTKVREPQRNLRILKAYLDKAGEGDHRALHHLGMEYAFHGMLADALRTLKRHTQIANWDDERCVSQLQLARVYANLGDYEQAIEWCCKALIEKSWPAPYFLLSRIFYGQASNGIEEVKNYARAVHWGQIGSQLPDAKTYLISDPLEKYRIQEIVHVGLIKLGKLDEAIASCEFGLRGLPTNELLVANLAICKAEKLKSQILAHPSLTEGSKEFITDVLNGKVNLKILTSQNNQMVEPVGSARLLEGRDCRATPEAGKQDVILYLGHGVEPWTPDSVQKTGIGGSETMAQEMAKRLASLGHRVRVYAHCNPTQEGAYDGVLYQDSSKFKNLNCDVLIASRRPEAVDTDYAVTAKLRILWVHDVHCGDALTAQRDLRFDKILCLSNWHKKFFLGCYPRINLKKVIVTRNGIDLSRFEQTVERNPHKAIYSSSPDRGLLAALEVWPRVRASVPDAELHVYYGFLNWESAARSLNDAHALRQIRHLRSLASNTPGVVLHDRVSQTELAREMLSSGVWFYPTWFSETSCITAMEAQAAGLKTITTPIAALLETCKSDLAFLEGAPKPSESCSVEYLESASRAVIEAMTSEEARTMSKEHSLDTLAAEWDAMLGLYVADIELKVVPDFHDGTNE